MKTYFENVIFIALFTISLIVLLTVLVVNPIWLKMNLHIPGEPSSNVDFTLPVDAVFYVRNAEYGYQWETGQKTSFWFHPLIAITIRSFPFNISSNYKFLFFSILFTFLSICFLNKFIHETFGVGFSAKFLTLIPLLPGGFVLGTSNAEIPSLFFNVLLLLSVQLRFSDFAVFLVGVLAILTKPNALYIVPVLLFYTILGKLNEDKVLSRKSIIGLFGILLAWAAWILVVDIKTGVWGTYFHVRRLGSGSLDEGVLSLFLYAARALKGNDVGEKLKYLTALFIPIVDIFILMVVKMKNESERFAQLLSLVSVLVVTFLINNPNKVIVYITTLPIHFSLGVVFILQTLFQNEITESIIHKIVKRLAGIFYIVYCLVLTLFFVIGTPLQWYY